MVLRLYNEPASPFVPWPKGDLRLHCTLSNIEATPVRIERMDEAALAEAAGLVSRAFLASPVFAEKDTERYEPECIAKQMRKGTQLLAYVGETMVGSATLFPPEPDCPCETFRLTPSVGLIAVDPLWQGKGIANRLLEAIEEEAVSAGYEELALSVTQRGTELMAMYERNRYLRIGTFHWPGVPDPSLIMRKALRPQT